MDGRLGELEGALSTIPMVSAARTRHDVQALLRHAPNLKIKLCPHSASTAPTAANGDASFRPFTLAPPPPTKCSMMGAP